MRLLLYLGTRGCRPTLEDALEGYLDDLDILVPVEPRLLGPALGEAPLDAGLREVAKILRERALRHAREQARREARTLTDVFDQPPPDPDERIHARILEGPLEEALLSRVQTSDAEDLHVARDALDVLADVGIRLGPALEPTGVAITAR